jgi:glycosyltransferase involved in cell wall biosynthesis
VDDASNPKVGNSELAASVVPAELVRHHRNRGVGAAILTGYLKALDSGADVAAVMAADGQMDPGELAAVLDPILLGQADYVKGNRLSHPDCPSAMPRVRRLGNYCLTWMTRLTTGLPGLMDSQCGYTALRLSALSRVPLQWVYPRYGFPNDFLAAAAGGGLRIAETVVTPLYRGEPSGIRPATATLLYPLILARSLLVRFLSASPGALEDVVRYERQEAG